MSDNQKGKELATQQEKANDIAAFFQTQSTMDAIMEVLPQHVSAERLLRTALTTIRTNPKILECSKSSLMSCVMGCAILGLEPEPFLGQAYIVPYNNKKVINGKDVWIKEAQLIPGYRGLIALARRAGMVQTVAAHVVYEKDEFDISYGLDDNIIHRPFLDGPRGDPKGAYVVFKFTDGSHSHQYMSESDIMAVARRSKTHKKGPKGEDIFFGPWKTDRGEMMKKTVIRRAIKMVPLSIEDARAPMNAQQLKAKDKADRAMATGLMADSAASSGVSQTALGMFNPDNVVDDAALEARVAEEVLDEYEDAEAIDVDATTGEVTPKQPETFQSVFIQSGVFTAAEQADLALFVGEAAEGEPGGVEAIRTTALTQQAGFIKSFKKWRQDKPADAPAPAKTPPVSMHDKDVPQEQESENPDPNAGQEQAAEEPKKRSRPTKVEMDAKRAEAGAIWVKAGKVLKDAETMVNSFQKDWNSSQCDRVIRDSGWKEPVEEAVEADESEKSMVEKTYECPDLEGTEDPYVTDKMCHARCGQEKQDGCPGRA